MYFKKTFIALTIILGLLITISTAKADDSKGYQAKVSLFAMASEQYALEMEMFLMYPDARGAEKIVLYQVKFKEAMKSISDPVIIACKKDIECSFYLEMGIKNFDNIDYLLPKVLKVMDGKGL